LHNRIFTLSCHDNYDSQEIPAVSSHHVGDDLPDDTAPMRLADDQDGRKSL
jgi:hypothetical protein